MNNLLALLVSLAMLFTGASMPDADADQALRAKTLVVDNITVEIGDEIVSLDPTAVIAVQTDGSSAAFDFYIDREGEHLLPFQVMVDDAELLALSDASNTTLRITAEELEELFQSGMSGSDEEGAKLVQAMLEKLMPAYADLFEMMKDPEQLQAFKAQAQAIYDEQIDRGEGVEERLYYEGETMLATTYEYDLNATDIGRLADAIYAANEVTTGFADAYFDLMALVPEESGLAGVQSFEELYQKLGATVDMHVVESIAENGLRIMDSVLTIDMEQLEAPMVYNIHSEEKDGEVSQTMDTVMTANGMMLEMSADITTTDDMDCQGYFTMIGNPAEEELAETDQGETEDEDSDEVPEEDVAEVEDIDDDDFEGEGDAEDALYFNCSFEYLHEQGLTMDYSFVTEGVEMNYSIETEPEGEDGSVKHVVENVSANNQYFGCSFDIHVCDQGFDVRIDESKAVSKDGVQPDMLLAGLGSDALKLYTDPGVQEIVGIYKNQMANLTESAEDETEDDEVDEDDEYDEEVPMKTISEPEFGYLPEGYEMTDLYMDDDGLYASVTISNEEDGGNVYVSLSPSWSDDEISTYVLADDGSYSEVDGMLVNCEVNGDYASYSADDGEVSYYIVPDGGSLSEDEIMQLIAGISFN